MSAVAPWQKLRDARLRVGLGSLSARVDSGMDLRREGVLKRVVGLTLEATGLAVPVGEHCRVETRRGQWSKAEVVGFSGDRTYLMASDEMHGLLPAARVVPLGRTADVAVGEGLLGRVIDGEGAALDARGELRAEDHVPLQGRVLNPLEREPIRQQLDVGVRVINAITPIGRGQRVGLFAGSGVGKSTLLGMMTRFTEADVIVVGLIGERGREVRDFIETTLGETGLRRSIVVAAPADRPPLARLNAAWRATAIAEWFRDQGRHVLLLMDSLTRFAQAQREIGLSVGEPPTTRGYPPSAFARLPALVERTGNGARGQGSITAFYTVLTEGDAAMDPIADAARAILDGHIVLSRAIAESGVYPAIDIEPSVSRVMHDITTFNDRSRIARLRQLVSAYQANRDLIAIGAYQPGADPRVDEALKRWPRILDFVRQEINESADIAASRAALAQLFEERP